MAITVVSNLTEISDAESATGWAHEGDGSSAGLNNDIFIQSAGSISSSLKASMAGNGRGSNVFSPTVNLDLTNTHIYCWLKFDLIPATFAAGGIYFRLETSTNVWSEYFVGGSDTYFGGWKCFVLDVNQTADREGTTSGVTITDVDRIGMGVETVTQINGNIETLFVDYLQYLPSAEATAIDIYGTTTAAGLWEDFFTELDPGGAGSHPAEGIIRKDEGVFYLNGPIGIGTGTNNADLSDDTSPIVVWENQLVEDNYYAIQAEGTGVATTKRLNLGTKVGTGDTAGGIEGGIIKTAGPAWALDLTEATFTDINLYGITFAGPGTTELDNVDIEGIGVNFDGRSQIEPGVGDLINGIVQNFSGASLEGGVLLPSPDTHNMRRYQFINNTPHAIEFSTASATPYTLEDFTYAGSGTTDSVNDTAGAVTANVNGGDSPTNTNGASATTTINNTKTLQVTVVDSVTGAVIPYASVTIVDSSDRSIVSEGVANNLGVYQDTGYNYTVDVDINVITRKSSPGATRYLAAEPPGKIINTGLTTTVGLTQDPRVALKPMTGVLLHGVQSEDVNDAVVTADVNLPAGSNRVLVVAGMYWDSTADLTVSAATYDGNGMTSINNLAVNEGADWHEVFLYRHAIPDGDEGVKTISFTFSAAVNIKAIAFAILDDVTAAPESNDTDSGNAVTGNPTLAVNNTTADSFSIGFLITDDLDSPTATGASENRVRRSDLARDALLNSVTVLVADRASAGAHNIGADFGANSKTWVAAGATFAKN
jgi:hypothetical protein